MSLLQLGLEWTCVGVLKGSNWDLFWDVYCIEILLVWLCEIVWGVLLPVDWEIMFVFWIRLA